MNRCVDLKKDELWLPTVEGEGFSMSWEMPANFFARPCASSSNGEEGHFKNKKLARVAYLWAIILYKSTEEWRREWARSLSELAGSPFFLLRNKVQNSQWARVHYDSSNGRARLYGANEEEMESEQCITFCGCTT